MTEYNKLVDHLVSTMPSNSSPMTKQSNNKPSDSIFYSIKNPSQNVGVGSTSIPLKTLFKLNNL